MALIARSMPDEDDLVRAWNLLRGAERPLLVIGKGAACVEFKRFVALLTLKLVMQKPNLNFVNSSM